MAFQDDLTTIQNNANAIDAVLANVDTDITGIDARIAKLVANQITPAQAAAVTALATQTTTSAGKLTGQEASLKTISTTTP